MGGRLRASRLPEPGLATGIHEVLVPRVRREECVEGSDQPTDLAAAAREAARIDTEQSERPIAPANRQGEKRPVVADVFGDDGAPLLWKPRELDSV